MIESELYTLEDARADMKIGYAPAKSSVLKWMSIISTLEEVRGVIGTYCGLCLAYPKCKGCPLGSCSDKYSSYVNAYNRVGDAIVEAKAMLAYIREKTEE